MKAKDLKNSDPLQMAVQGKLVPQDPSDEPASVLLERTRTERAQLIKEKKIKAPKGGESMIYLGSDGSRYEKRSKGEPVCIDDEIPFDIPEGWEWARLEGITTYIQRGKSPKSTHSKKNIPLSLRNAINGQGSRWRGRSSSTRTALHRMPRRGCSLTATCSGTRRGWAPLAAWPSTIRTKTLTGGRLPTATLRSSGPCPTGCATNMRSSTLRARRSNPLSRIRRAVQRSRRSLRKRR